MGVCPDIGVKDFPIQNDVAITDVLNQSIQETFSFEFRFGPRSNVPSFVAGNQAFIDEGNNHHGGATENTLRLRGNNYTLRTVQITVPLHSKFLKTEIRNIDRGEIVMVFNNTSGLGEAYCIVCIPLIDRSTQNPPLYLDAIRNDRLPNRPVSLESLIPIKRDFISYVTCLSQTKDQKTVATQAQVFVFVSGLEYDGSKIDALRNMYSTAPGVNGVPRRVNKSNFAELALPDSLIAKTSNTPFKLTNETDYKAYLRYGLLAASSQGGGSGGRDGRRIDSTDSYKCVPLSPTKNIVDKHIVVNTDEGVPLSKVLEDKASDEKAEGSEILPGDVERMIAIVIGTILGLFVLSILAYIFTLITSKNAGPAFPWLTDQYKNMLPTVFIATVVGISGFLIGFFTQNMGR